jgi:hypothetical protein
VVVLGFMYLASPCGAQDRAISEDAIRLIQEEVRSSLMLGNEALFLTRRVDLEEDLTDLQYIAKSPGLKPGTKIPVGCIAIVDIRRQGFTVENGTIVQAVVDVDDAPLWSVAYDCATKKVFHLHGFPDDYAGFGNLMKVINLHVRTESLALVVFSTFTGLTYRKPSESAVRDELDLMAAVIPEFSGPRSRKAFSVFWNRCPVSVRNQVKPPSASSVTEGFRITFFSYANGRVKRNSVLFREDGSLDVIKSIVLFQW